MTTKVLIPEVASEPTGMKLVGRCKDCRFWELPAVGTSGCPIVITTEETDDEHITLSDFGCVRWEPIEEADGA
ncbi:MAG: hypothetical protein JRE40_04995 [Deltaproteobacteria bacterium]|nr:hypothetical protein [Deltaproteobacteria bacterium]